MPKYQVKDKPEQNYFKDEVHRVDNVIPLGKPCLSDKCRKKADQLGFCPTHYEWFKAGLLKKDGSKPKDFDKKYFHYMKKSA